MNSAVLQCTSAETDIIPHIFSRSHNILDFSAKSTKVQAKRPRVIISALLLTACNISLLFIILNNPGVQSLPGDR